jgi:hypothetical protein
VTPLVVSFARFSIWAFRSHNTGQDIDMLPQALRAF